MIDLIGLTLKPIMIPLLAFASSTSDLVIPPVAALKITSETPSTWVLVKTFFIASSEPWTSVFKIITNFLYFFVLKWLLK